MRPLCIQFGSGEILLGSSYLCVSFLYKDFPTEECD